MTKTEKAKDEFINHLKEQTGLVPDRWGHFKFVTEKGKKYRVKIKKQVWRFEMNVANRWVKLASGKFDWNEFSYLSQRINRKVKDNEQ